MASIKSLIHHISNDNIKSFFLKTIGSFSPQEDVFPDIIKNDEPFGVPTKIGEAQLKNHEELVVFSCAYKKDLNERSAKKRQFEIARKILGEDFKDGAIFIFYDENGNFRFSFIRRYYGEKQKYSNWKRFTYFVQPRRHNKTFKKQVGLCDFDSLDAIQGAFSVAKFSKEFYQKLSYWYFGALDEVKFPNEYNEDQNQVHAQAMIRLITRMIFVWFMKEKKLIPDEIFDKSYLDQILNYQDKTGSTYYKAILQNLFFATLNTEMGEKRKWITTSGYGIPNFYRYKRFFKAEKAEDFIQLMRKIPFLNGGLFENLDIVHTANPEKNIPAKDIRIDCFSDNPKNEVRIKVPDYLFFGIREADISTYLNDKRKNHEQVTGLIDLLKSYHFTIDENSEDDQEVALDPELLGTVFENLLASYNPETQTTARKESGSFYTPRPIVNYMVKESLFYHLQEKTGIVENKLQPLIEANETNDLIEAEKQAIVKTLTHIKILDPACGSGAFPMGALQHLVRLLNLVDPENRLYQQKLEEKLKQELTRTIDESSYEELKANIEEVFNNPFYDADYARKLFLIQNCLYGVDIQAIALQISKLRFFISLLVEQKIDKTKENYGIKPLPNLETKFVAANTLIGINKDDGRLKNLQIEKLEDELGEVRERHFNARTPKTKRKYRAQEKEIREKIAQLFIDGGWENKSAQQIADWDPFDQNSSAEWFDPEWMFGTAKFDVVIGNPPFIDSETMTKKMPEFREQLKSIYKTTRGNWDIFVPFIERGIQLCSGNGSISYIVPNKLIGAKYAKTVRKFINELELKEIRDYSRQKIFETADVFPITFIIKNITRKEGDVTCYNIMNSKLEIEWGNSFIGMQKNENWDKFFLKEEAFDIISKMEMGKLIVDTSSKVLGAATVSESYEIKKVLRDEEYIPGTFKFINTGTIDPYVSLWGKKKTQYIKGRYSFPRIKKSDIEKINTTRLKEALSPKIIIAGMVKEIESFLDFNGDYMAGKSTVILLNEDLNYLSFVTAVLNSSLSTFYLNSNYYSLKMSGGYLSISPTIIKEFPLPKQSLNELKLNKIGSLVKLISQKKQSGEDTSQEEAEIDLMVYKLYELTYEEVKIVDPEFEMSEEEYEAYTIN